MKTKAFQTKRKSKLGFRTLYAKTRKRKQRVSAAAAGGDFAVEEPNLGVARALVVILILHVAAIIAIVVHSSSNDDQVVASTNVVAEPSTSARTVAQSKQAERPKIGAGDKVEYVQQGDTYQRFARRYGVDVQELRRLNNSTALRYGMALIMPKPAVPNLQQLQPAVAQADPIIQEVLPPIVAVPARASLPTDYEVVGPAEAIQVTSEPFPDTTPLPPQPRVEIRETANVRGLQPVPKVEPLPVTVIEPTPVIEPEPVPVQVVEATPAPKPTPKPAAKPKTKSYSIRKGDTFWSVARRNGISVQKLQAANRGVNANALRIGTKINIPAR